MKINETIKHLQSSIKVRSNLISQEEKERNTLKTIAKLYTLPTLAKLYTDIGYGDAKLYWRHYHRRVDNVNTLAKQQKIEKNLYKYLLDVRKAVGFLVD